MLLKCCTQYASNFGTLSRVHRTVKCQFSFQFQRKAMTKNVQTTAQLHSSLMLANNSQNPPSQPQQYTNWELPDVQAGFRKYRGSRDQTVKNHWITGKAREFQKKINYIYFIECAKALTVWIAILWEFLKRWEQQTTLSASWETCMQIEKQRLKLYLEQWTGSKLGKEYLKAVYCHPAYLASIQII